MEPLSATERTLVDRPIATFGIEEPIAPGAVAGAIQSSLSMETSVRNGFDVFMATTNLTRRRAVDLIRLAEEAGVRIGVARRLRRTLNAEPPCHLVTMVANPKFGLEDLVDLTMWMTGTRSVLRLEIEEIRASTAVTIRGNDGALISIQLTPGVHDLHVFVDGNQSARMIPLALTPQAGFMSELRLFASQEPGFVSLEDSLDVISVLERAGALSR